MISDPTRRAAVFGARATVRSFATGIALALIAGCASRTPAPIESRPALPPKPGVAAPAPPPPAAPETDWRPQAYTVKRGDTLYQIALDHGLDYRELAAWNGIENVNIIRVGQVLQMAAPNGATGSGVTTAPLRTLPPIGSADARPPAAAPATPILVPPSRNADNYKSQPKAVKEPYSELALREMQRASAVAPPAAPTVAPPAAIEPAAPPVVARAEPKPETNPSAPAGVPNDDEKLDWIWPATGKVVTGFSDTANLKGIDIAGKSGAPVAASAAGKIVYAGTGLRGYGKLIIVKHNATYLSAYAHNKEILVKEGQQVTRGQKIAEMGDTDSTEVKLHFEIRKLGKPVDPLKFLPPG